MLVEYFGLYYESLLLKKIVRDILIGGVEAPNLICQIDLGTWSTISIESIPQSLRKKYDRNN